MDKQAEIARIKAEYEARNREIDRQHKNAMAKLYGGAALQIGSALIPGTLGLKGAGAAIKAITPYVGKKIAENAITGTISGLASGAVEGIGRGLMDGENPWKTMVSDGAISALLGGSLGLVGGKVAKLIDEKALAKGNKLPQQYFDEYVAGLSNNSALGKISPFSKEFGKFKGLRDGFTPVSKNTGSEFLFAGENALNADKVALGKAKELFEQGADNETIRQNTGWFKGVDDKWRYEIEDGNVDINQFFLNRLEERINQNNEMIDLFKERGWEEKIPEYLEDNNQILQQIENFDKNFDANYVKNYGGFSTKLPDLYKNDTLYAAYPELANTKVHFIKDSDPTTVAYFNPGKGFKGLAFNTNYKDFSLDNLKRDFSHEIQHYIQGQENFAQGGSLQNNWDDYFKLAGETEARLAGKRAYLTPEQKLSTPIKYDVAPSEQIIKFNDDGLYQKLIDNEEFDYNKAKNLAKDLRNGERNPLKYKAKDAKIENISPRQREYIFNEVNTTASDIEKEKGLVTRRLHNYDEEVDYLYTTIYDKDGNHEITRSIKIDEDFYDK